jgi:hypothetical protein
MTPVTFVFQFYDAFVEGIQFFFQFLNFMLNRKSPSRKFIDGWSLLWARTLQASSPLCRHGPSESRAGGYVNLACFSPEVALCCLLRCMVCSAGVASRRPLLKAKPTFRLHVGTSQFDPSATSARSLISPQRVQKSPG